MDIIFAGTPQFAAQHLQALMQAGFNIAAVLTQPDRPGKRGKKPVPSQVKTLALKKGLEVRQPEKLTLADLEGIGLEGRGADVMVVVAYGQILSKEVLAYPRLGCINVHASLLPRWRGAAPIQRAILAGDDTTGITVIQMDEGLDTGDELARTSLPITSTDTDATLEAKLAEAGVVTLIDTLLRLETITPKPQPAETDGYAKKISKAEALIAWSQPAAEIDRQIRAFNPLPVAYSFLGDMRVKFWQAKPMPDTLAEAPGTIVALDKQAVTIACGDGSLAVTGLQLPLGKGSILSSADIINARTKLVHQGLVFGGPPADA